MAATSRCELCVLVDNAPAEGLASEWGLSILVGMDASTLLLDFGQSDAFARNARVLGQDLSAVDAAVLSHAHYDHADGLEHFLAANDHAPLYLSEACGEDLWSTKGGTTEAHYIGIRRHTLERHATRLRRVSCTRVSEVVPWAYLVPHWLGGERHVPDAPGMRGMYRRRGAACEPDRFLHEMTLVVRSEGGLVVLSSCTHVGLGQVVREVTDAFAGERVKAFVGGLHLMHATEDEVRAQARLVRELGMERLVVGHCTGDAATEVLVRELGDGVTTLSPGLRLSL